MSFRHLLHIARCGARANRRPQDPGQHVIFDNRPAVYEAMWADFRKARAEVDLTEIQTTIMELNDAEANVARWMKPVAAKTPFLLMV